MTGRELRRFHAAVWNALRARDAHSALGRFRDFWLDIESLKPETLGLAELASATLLALLGETTARPVDVVIALEAAIRDLVPEPGKLASSRLLPGLRALLQRNPLPEDDILGWFTRYVASGGS